MLALTRMAVRAGVLAALVATVLSVASGLAAGGDLQALEAHAEDALDWLRDLWRRFADIDPSVGEIQLADLASPSGWIDLGAGLFGGGEQPVEIDPALIDSVDLARIVDGAPLGQLPDLDGLGEALPVDPPSIEPASINPLAADG